MEATAQVRADDETAARLQASLRAKYGVKYTMIRAAQKLWRRGAGSVALVLR